MEKISPPPSAAPRAPTMDQIAERAYALWLAEGRPDGRDLHHWREAEAQLRREIDAEAQRRSQSNVSPR